MVKRIFLTFICVLSCFCLGSCQKKDTQLKDDNKPYVVSTTAMIDELVSSIGKDKIQTEILIKGDIDPHSYELVKGDSAKLKKADVIFYQGLGLEHGASLVSYLKSNPKAYSCGDVLLKECSSDLIYHDGYLDPHVWLDLSLFEKFVPFIAEHLIEIDPQNKDFYLQNAQELKEKMQKLDQDIVDLLSKTPQEKRFLVTAHSAFSYFTRRYIAQHPEWHKHCTAPEGLAPEAQISLYDIERVVAYIKTNSVGIIFSESNVSRDALKKILDVCSKSGCNIQLFDEPLFGDALFNEKSYLDMMWHNATLLHKAWYDSSISSQD